MAAYSYYKAGKYDDAVSAADRYLTLHPGTPEADLAQNIIGMAYYVQVLDPKRDQTNARKALAAYDAAAALSRAPLCGRGLTTARASCATCWRKRDAGRALLSAQATIISRPSTASASW